MPSTSAITALKPEKDNRQQGLGDFQSRLNRGSAAEERRPRDNGWNRNGTANGTSNGFGERRNERDQGGRSWENTTPRTARSDRDMDGGSMRVPSRGWDETPRSKGAQGWSKTDDPRRKGWDQTPSSRSVRGGDEDEMLVNGKEWEEEQVRLDRDWYIQDDEGAVVSPSSEA
jgi:pre-mRNA-splicing factor ATP-dependent RNA helicase DHX38/PRP16